MISAIILKDSTNWLGNRLTTLELKYPRYIHSEFMTHRVFSKNAASSRAIPLNKMIKDIEENTVYPIWTKANKGMQGEIIADEILIDSLDNEVDKARDLAINSCLQMNMGLVHKQNLNRYLEPFQYIRVICTGTEWDNFFELRCHEAAMPEIRELAEKIRFAIAISEPQFLQPGEWHLPFGDKIENGKLNKLWMKYNPGILEKRGYTEDELKLKISVARCARISYLTHDGEIDYKKDIELYDRLVSNEPRHLSPTEHQGRVPFESELKYFESKYEVPEKTGILQKKPIYHKGKYISNLQGWIQYRKLIENETYG